MLIAYVVMPDHAHLLLQPLSEGEHMLQAWCDYTEFYKVEKILGSIKKFYCKRDKQNSEPKRKALMAKMNHSIELSEMKRIWMAW